MKSKYVIKNKVTMTLSVSLEEVEDAIDPFRSSLLPHIAKAVFELPTPAKVYADQIKPLLALTQDYDDDTQASYDDSSIAELRHRIFQLRHYGQDLRCSDIMQLELLDALLDAVAENSPLTNFRTILLKWFE